ncbi:MAG: ADP-ribosylation factor-like protein [Candidatus Asgardarchaeia archaeon]
MKSSSKSKSSLCCIKVSLIGGDCAGKTTFANVLFNGHPFGKSYKMTLGADFFTRTFVVNSIEFKVSVWDLNCRYRFRELLKHYFAYFFYSY